MRGFVAVCSGKGSPGATFVAANLSAALVRADEVPMLLDLDPSGGDVCAYLGLDPRRGIYPFLRMDGVPGEPDRLLAEADEVGGIPAVGGFPDASYAPSADTLRAVVELAKRSGRLVVADLGRISDQTAEVAAGADVVVLVVRPDLVSVLGAQRALDLLRRALPAERITAVVSGLERRRLADRPEIAQALGLPVAGLVPLDHRGASKALVAQRPAVSRRLRRAFDRLAGELERLLEASRIPLATMAGAPPNAEPAEAAV